MAADHMPTDHDRPVADLEGGEGLELAVLGVMRPFFTAEGPDSERWFFADSSPAGKAIEFIRGPRLAGIRSADIRRAKLCQIRFCQRFFGAAAFVSESETSKSCNDAFCGRSMT